MALEGKGHFFSKLAQKHEGASNSGRCNASMAATPSSQMRGKTLEAVGAAVVPEIIRGDLADLDSARADP